MRKRHRKKRAVPPREKKNKRGGVAHAHVSARDNSAPRPRGHEKRRGSSLSSASSSVSRRERSARQASRSPCSEMSESLTHVDEEKTSELETPREDPAAAPASLRAPSHPKRRSSSAIGSAFDSGTDVQSFHTAPRYGSVGRRASRPNTPSSGHPSGRSSLCEISPILEETSPTNEKTVIRKINDRSARPARGASQPQPNLPRSLSGALAAKRSLRGNSVPTSVGQHAAALTAFGPPRKSRGKSATSENDEHNDGSDASGGVNYRQPRLSMQALPRSDRAVAASGSSGVPSISKVFDIEPASRAPSPNSDAAPVSPMIDVEPEMPNASSPGGQLKRVDTGDTAASSDTTWSSPENEAAAKDSPPNVPPLHLGSKQKNFTSQKALEAREKTKYSRQNTGENKDESHKNSPAGMHPLVALHESKRREKVAEALDTEAPSADNPKQHHKRTSDPQSKLPRKLTPHRRAKSGLVRHSSLRDKRNKKKRPFELQKVRPGLVRRQSAVISREKGRKEEIGSDRPSSSPPYQQGSRAAGARSSKSGQGTESRLLGKIFGTGRDDMPISTPASISRGPTDEAVRRDSKRDILRSRPREEQSPSQGQVAPTKTPAPSTLPLRPPHSLYENAEPELLDGNMEVTISTVAPLNFQQNTERRGVASRATCPPKGRLIQNAGQRRSPLKPTSPPDVHAANTSGREPRPKQKLPKEAIGDFMIDCSKSNESLASQRLKLMADCLKYEQHGDEKKCEHGAAAPPATTNDEVPRVTNNQNEESPNEKPPALEKKRSSPQTRSAAASISSSVARLRGGHSRKLEQRNSGDKVQTSKDDNEVTHGAREEEESGKKVDGRRQPLPPSRAVSRVPSDVSGQSGSSGASSTSSSEESNVSSKSRGRFGLPKLFRMKKKRKSRSRSKSDVSLP